MAHRVFVGPFAALEQRWIEEIVRLQHHDPLRRVVVLVGSNLLAVYLRRRMAEEGRAVANLRFHTFLDLATRLANHAPSPDRKARMPRLGLPVILESILREHTPDVFAPVAGFAGFRDALLDTFRDLRDAGITPDNLDSSMRSWLRAAPDRRAFSEAMSDIYRRLRGKATHFEDVDDDFRAASAYAGSAPAALDCSCLLVYGIYDLTGQQQILLDALGKVLEMTYFVPFVNHNVSAFARGFVERLQRTLNASREALSGNPKGTSLSSLWNADFGLSEGSSQPQSKFTFDRPDGSCVFVSAPGDSRCATEIAREILRAVRDGVIGGFHESAVLLRHPEEDLPLLTEALRLRRIPYFVHGGSPFSRRPLSRAVAAVCLLEPAHFTRQSILSAVELISAAVPSEQAIWDAPRWRALTNEPRFLAGLESWDVGTRALVRETAGKLRLVESSPAGENATMLSPDVLREKVEAAKALRLGWRALRRAAAGWPSSLSWTRWSQLLQENLEPILGGSRDWPAFLAVLDELETLDRIAGPAAGVPEVSRAEMTTALLESLAAHSREEGKFQRRGVNLLSISAARGLRFPLVIIPGLDEGRFPARLRQDPMLLDSERKGMSSAGRVPLKSGRAEEEKLLFDMAARSATRRLVLMTSRLDESSDRERIPSRFFLSAAGALSGRELSLRDFTQGSVPGFRSVSLDNPAPGREDVAVDEGEIRLRLITADHSSSRAVLESLAVLQPELLKASMAYDRARWMRKLTEFDGRFHDRKMISWIAAAAGPAAGPVSASRLEDYARCPYRFYLKRVVRLEEWQEEGPARQMDPLERGQTIHQVLELFLRSLPAGAFATQSAEELGAILHRRALEELDKAHPPGMPDLLWDVEKDQLVAMLNSWLKFEISRSHEGYSPVYFERIFGDFGGGGKGAQLRIAAGPHHFDLRGRIDRIDLSDDSRRARVIDYKTGALPDSMQKNAGTPLMSGEKIQLAIYAKAVLSEFDGVENIDGEYLHLQPKDATVVSCLIKDGRLRPAIRSLPAVLQVIGDGILSGIFFDRARGSVRPSGHCEYCEYLAICGKDRVRRQERKAGDAAVVRFQQMHDAEATAGDES